MHGDNDELETGPYNAPSGGWGSLASVAKISGREKVGPETLAQYARQNKTGGFMCVSCAWGKPANPHPAEFCENGAKATAWELTSLRNTPDFFQRHSVTELLGWRDHDLEQAGRLTHPLRYDPDTDRYVAVSWADAFADIGAKLRPLDPDKVTFYASGRASNETSYMWGLMARLYGSHNLPDSSNMCHETTSVGLKSAIGSPVGTIQLQDYEKCEAILYFGQNPGVNSPRFLHPLRECAKRGVEIIVFNPLIERGLERFTDPQNPVEMLGDRSTPIATQYHQVKAGGDIAALLGIAKWLLAEDDRVGGVIDHAFVAEHTHGFDSFAAWARSTPWTDIERESGLKQVALETAARAYARSRATIAVYGMGLTQHRHGIANVQMLVNVMLMRGNIGKPGAGMGPVRGHSNVQGQRTVGITEKPELVPNDKLKELYGFDPPDWKGMDTIATCEAVRDGELQGFLQLGGNFFRAVPDYELLAPRWRDVPITVHIATKLNRSHLLPGRTSYILPCLGRIERDTQATGEQAVTMEDSFSHIYGSLGRVTPAADTLLSEPAIVAGIAQQICPPNPNIDWDAWVGDYRLIRDAIERTYPEMFERFNERLWVRGGFWKGNAAAHREWKTETNRAEFNTFDVLSATGFEDAPDRYRLITLRSNDQFNTTVYGYDDRFRGIHGTRDVVLLNDRDIATLGLAEGDLVTLVGDYGDGVDRRVAGLKVIRYNIPDGCVGGYYPELNTLLPIAHHAIEAHVLAGKAIPVRVEKQS